LSSKIVNYIVGLYYKRYNDNEQKNNYTRKLFVALIRTF